MTTQTYRKTSSTLLFGLPLYDFAHGPDQSTGLPWSKAKGILAIGDQATGVIAIGALVFGYKGVGALMFLLSR